MDAPQCHSSNQPAEWQQSSANVASKSTMGQNSVLNLELLSAAWNTDSKRHTSILALPDDVLFQILLYCGPVTVEESIKLVCHRLQSIVLDVHSFRSNTTSFSLALWKEFCTITGKSLEKRYANTGTLADYDCAVSAQTTSGAPFFADTSLSYKISVSKNLYRKYYFRNPCVPVDFETISEALKFCPRMPSRDMIGLGDEKRFYSSVGTVVLAPGVYNERVRIDGEVWTVGQTLRAVALRAAFPGVGAALVHYHAPNRCAHQNVEVTNSLRDLPCISILTRDNDGIDGVQKGISVKISHLKVLHSVPGADIWGGNTAICVDGPRAQVIIDSCVLQSDSGRGLVVTNQAELQMTRTSIVDCAATGFYLGDWGSRARITSCNIVRNGFGSRRFRIPSEEDRAEIDSIRNQFAMHARVGQPLRRDQFEVVPPGHSGVYIESSMAWVDDSLLAGNSLTGLSVVRSGFVNMSGCDVTENGHLHSDPVMIEDAHDVRDANRLQGISIRGGVVEGPLPNNYTSIENTGEEKVFKGGRIREAAYHCMKEPMTELSLVEEFHGPHAKPV